MKILSLRLVDFRSYRSYILKPSEHKNIILGENGRGKTNLLEAIGMCINGKSFRNSKDKDLINFQAEAMCIEAKADIAGLIYDIKILMTKEVKTIYINEKVIKSLRELAQIGSKVVFTPDDIFMIKGSPQDRRNFLDSCLENLTYIYEFNNKNYKKVLAQRNKLLKMRNTKDFDSLINIYDRQLVKYGSYLIRSRKRYIDRLLQVSALNFKKIFSQDAKFHISYKSCLEYMEDEREMQKEFLKLLKDNLERDRYFGNTSIGPHREDLEFYFNQKDLKDFGSQGQVRSAVLALKISECQLVKELRGINPILLLDDVFSELDEKRRKDLFSNLGDLQSFITTTDFDIYEEDANIIRI
ncbi:putative DNA replication and repair protein RecF [Clostridiales bacterium KA00134]|nr:putative DNA replication and repair protein RecF [Clostridiales bacterium KA00134]